MSSRRGLVVGKFVPPHAGHHLVIERALATCAAVDVVVCDRPGQVPPAAVRAGWLAEIHPAATVRTVPDICAWHGDDPCPARCSPRWAGHLTRLGLGPWDLVFGSEGYLGSFARHLGAAPVLVDADRHDHPVSGTSVRGDPAAHWGRLHPVVRAGLVRRVVVLGAESTGTTTLAAGLARRLGVPWVPEYGRAYSEERAAAAGSIWNVTWRSEDFDVVAAGQERLEAEAIRSWVQDGERSRPGPLGPLAVCDTDVLATAVWHRRYCGTSAPAMLERAHARPPLLYVLTSPAGVPFEQDGLRDGEHVRDAMTGWFRDALGAQPVPWIEVTGGPDERVDRVAEQLAAVVQRVPLLATGSAVPGGTCGGRAPETRPAG